MKITKTQLKQIIKEESRKLLSEGREDYNPKVNELLCQVMEAMYGDNIPLTLITFGDPASKDKKQFVAVKDGRSDRMETCVVQYQGPSTMDALTSKGLGYGGGYDEPTGIPLEEEDK